MQQISYAVPRSAEEAVATFASAGPGARYVAGGTTLFDLMKLNIERPARLIDVTRVAGLDRIDSSGDAIRLGSNATMADVAADRRIARDYPVLQESLTKAASQQLRNMATVGANLLQRTRCLYFRNGAGASGGTSGLYPCNKRLPGSGCAAIGGLDRGQAILGTSSACTAVSPGDWPVALVAMDAQVELLGTRGPRVVPIAELYRLPGATPDIEFTLLPGELVTGITIPKTRAGQQSTYHKIRDRESYAFALASAAVALAIDDGRVTQAHVALGGLATRPWRAPAAEQFLIGKPLDRITADAAARLAFTDARPGRDNKFKVELGVRTLADALLIAAKRNVR